MFEGFGDIETNPFLAAFYTAAGFWELDAEIEANNEKFTKGEADQIPLLYYFLSRKVLT